MGVMGGATSHQVEVGVVSDMIDMRRGRKDVALGLSDPGWGAGKDDDARA